MCRLLGVSSSGYHAWVKRQPSRRAETDAALTVDICVAHAASRGTYGAPRIHAELAAKDIRVGRKRVARLMRQAGVAGVSRRKFVTTTVKGNRRQAPDPHLRRGRLWSSATLPRTHLIGCGLPTLPIYRPGPASCISRWCSMPTAAQPPHRRLADGDDTCHPTGARRAEHGASDAAAAGRDPSLRPGLAGWAQMVVATLQWRSCDDKAQAAFGSVWSGAIVLTRSSGGGSTR